MSQKTDAEILQDALAEDPDLIAEVPVPGSCYARISLTDFDPKSGMGTFRFVELVAGYGR